MPAAKKKTAKKKTTTKKKASGKSLWDHLTAIKTIQDPKYFDKLTESDLKTWNNYMILRTLSYNDDYLILANELNRLYNLTPKQLYTVLIDFLPKQKTYEKFIRGKNEGKYSGEILELVARYFEISEIHAVDYLDMFYSCDEGKRELIKITETYGWDAKQQKQNL